MIERILLYGFVLILSAGLAACTVDKAAEQKGPPPVAVTTYQVEPGNATYYDDYPASVVALNQVEIRPEVSGYIVGISFKDGQHVIKGTKLYAIDQQLYQAAYDQARANLNVAKANLAKARQDADRYIELAKNDAVARQTLEHAQADLESATMQVQAVEANVNSAETNLRYSTIVAPFDGTVGISQVKLGSSVTAGQTLLNTVSSDDPMGVDCSIDEKQIGRFTQLLDRRSDGKDSMFTMILPDQSLYQYTGHLSLLDRAVDPQTGTIRMRVEFPNPKNILRAGLTCNLRVRNSAPAASLLIPFRAVVEQMGEYFVFAVNGNRVSQRRVTLGMTINAMVVVQDGLKQGDQIVVEGMQKLRDNSLVLVTPAGAAASAASAHGS